MARSSFDDRSPAGAAQRGLSRLMLTMPAARRQLQMLSGKCIGLLSLCEAYEDANATLDRLLRQAGDAKCPMVEEYRTVCREIESDVLRYCLDHAINAPAHITVYTLDLPPDTAPRFELAPGERVFVEKPRSGRHFVEAAPQWRTAAARITQAFGDSATFDWSAHHGRAGLVFVDGSHAYDYVLADTETALRLIAPGRLVIWHDYGVWEGVTRALEEIEASRRLGLRHIRGTSLVVWKS